MAIPVNSVVSVAITLGAVYPSKRGFGTLLIVTNETGIVGIAEGVRFYSDIDAVGGDWGTSSEAYAAAQAYFGQQPKPTILAIAPRFEADQAAELRGGSNSLSVVATWAAIADGEFTISIDGVEEDITCGTFAAVTDMDDVAAIIETALQAVAAGGFTAATCTHDGDRFFITSGTTGALSTISFASTVSAGVGTDISGLLDMTIGEALKTDGFAGETITESLTRINTVSDQWYGFVFTKEMRDAAVVNLEDGVEAAADWAEARVKIFGNTSNDLGVLDSADSTDIASTLKVSNLRRTITTFSSHPAEYPSASIIARAFVVNFNQPNSTLTLKFKQMPAITTEDLNTNQVTTLNSKNANALINVGGNAMYAESKMANGVFFDEVHGVDWLTEEIQNRVFGYLLTKATKVPYTDKGIAAVAQQVSNALDVGVRNGLIAPGEDIEGNYLARGYEITTIPVSDISPADKQARHYPGLSFIALGAGAIHSVQIDGVFER